MINFVKEAPAECALSPHHREKAVCFFSVMFFGGTYWVPVSPVMKKYFHITESHGVFHIDEKCGKVLETMAQDMVASVYYEIRETLAVEVESTLKRHITDKFNNLVSTQLGTAVRDGMRVLEQKGEI